MELQVHPLIWQLPPRYTIGEGFMTQESRVNRISNARGIKVFDGDHPLYDARQFNAAGLTTHDLLFTHRVWRPDDTTAAAEILQEVGRVAIIGGPQSGKGTILYGLGIMCDVDNVGYVTIDSHYQEVEAHVTCDVIRDADRAGRVIFYDSLDYLFAGTNRLRKLKTETHIERTREIVHALEKVSVPIVVTMHDAYWQHTYTNPQQKEEHRAFLETFGYYELPRYLESHDARAAFLIDHGFSQAEIEELMCLPDNTYAQTALSAETSNGNYIHELALGCMDYGALKLMARDSRYEGFRDALLAMAAGNDYEHASREAAYGVVTAHKEMDFMTSIRYCGPEKLAKAMR